ncbi:MAG: hypothetical protein HFG73_06940 [Hungatella sp.]|nr:hypothetical protein [Hungatella sp.]
MMFENANQRAEEMEGALGGTQGSYRMAKVTGLQGGRPVLLFNGETANSRKLYKYLKSYSPAVGDMVLLARVGRTYVILGKVV